MMAHWNTSLIELQGQRERRLEDIQIYFEREARFRFDAWIDSENGQGI